MIATVTLLGASNRPIEGIPIPRWFYIYFVEWENGAVDIIESEDYLVTEEGDYKTGICDIPLEEAEYGYDLLGGTATRQDGPGEEREVCEYSALCWT